MIYPYLVEYLLCVCCVCQVNDVFKYCPWCVNVHKLDNVCLKRKEDVISPVTINDTINRIAYLATNYYVSLSL